MTKEKRLAATKETKEQKDLLTEVWKRRIVSEKGYSETIAERIAEKVKSLANYMQYGRITDRTATFNWLQELSFLTTETFTTLMT